MESDHIPYAAIDVLPASRVLVLAPHADDEVFGCGGAIAAHVARQVPVQVIVLTDGALFGDPGARLEESRAAAALLGYGEPVCWGLPDRGLVHDEELERRLLEAIATADADLVYAPSPHEIHPDHRALALAARAAVRRGGGARRLAQYEVGVPLRPNRLLDITPFHDLKLAAMRCFVSQLEKQRYDLHIDALNRYRTYTLPAQVEAAEAYDVVTAAELAAAEPAAAGLAARLGAWARRLTGSA